MGNCSMVLSIISFTTLVTVLWKYRRIFEQNLKLFGCFAMRTLGGVFVSLVQSFLTGPGLNNNSNAYSVLHYYTTTSKVEPVRLSTLGQQQKCVLSKLSTTTTQRQVLNTLPEGVNAGKKRF